MVREREGGANLGLQIAMCDPFVMHYRQSAEQLLDYHFRIIFVPSIIIHKGLRHIPDRDILHSNVHVVLVLIGGVEFDEPFVLPTGYTKPPVNRMGLMLAMKGCNFGQNLHSITPPNS